jgi:Tfp pilus assembly protein PilO
MFESLKPLLIATGLLIALSIGWYFLLYRPDAKKLESVEADFEDLVLKVQSFSVSEAQISTFETQIKKLDDEIALTQSKLITKEELSGTIKTLKKRAGSYGLKFTTILPDFDSLMDDPENKGAAEEVLQLHVQMKIQGRYKNFGKFTESFTSLPFLISIDDLTLLFNPKTHPKIDILVEAILYLRRYPKALSST